MGEFRACAKDPHCTYLDCDRVHLVPRSIPWLHGHLTQLVLIKKLRHDFDPYISQSRVVSAIKVIRNECDQSSNVPVQGVSVGLDASCVPREH